VNDSDRVLLLRAERELGLLGTIINHADLSNVALDRARAAMEVITAALELQRPELGLAPNRLAA
jgi:hypothetical protein